LNRLRYSWYYSLLSKSAALFAVASLLTIDCEQRDELIGLINIMLVKHLTLNVILINELMLLLCLARLLCSEAFDFTQYH